MSIKYDEIYDKINLIVAEQLNISKDAIKKDSTFDSLGVDSLDRVEIIMKLENEFNTEISDEAADKINSVDQATEYIISSIK